MRRTNDSALSEDIFYEVLSYFSYDGDSDTLLKWALVSSSWARICRSPWTLELSPRNFQGLQELLKSPLTSFSWVRNLSVVVFKFQSQPVAADWFHETVPYLAALKRVNSLSLLHPPHFSNFDELLNLLCVFPSLQSVVFSGVHISDWTWSPSRPRQCPSLSRITLRETNPGIFHWLQSQKAIHPVRSFSVTIMDTEEFEQMDSFLRPISGMLQHLHIMFVASPVTFSLENYKNLRSLQLANVRDVKLVSKLLKQVTSTELKHLILDWDIIRYKYPCDWSELGDILSGDQFSNLSMVEIYFYIYNLYDAEGIAEAEAEIRRFMPKRHGQHFYRLKLQPRLFLCQVS